MSCLCRLTGAVWFLCNVYGLQGKVPKINFLAEVKAGVQLIQEPLAILGDFNLIVEVADKNNSAIDRGLMLAFRQFINDLQMKDLHMHGRRFTWCNGRLNPTMCRLDWVLYNQGFHDVYPKAML